MVDMTILVAFGAGILSFLAPCVLPLVPGFLAYLGGSMGTEGEPRSHFRSPTFHASIFFVSGFVVAFAILGVLLHGALDLVSSGAQVTLARIGGAVVVFFGLYLMGLVKIPFLERPHAFSVRGLSLKSRWISAFVFGVAFAIGWTPCVGVALGAIFGLAALAPAKAFVLLFAYALGLGVPFLVIGFFAAQFERYLNRNFAWVQYVNILFGGVLVWLGVLAFLQDLSQCREVLWHFPF